MTQEEFDKIVEEYERLQALKDNAYENGKLHAYCDALKMLSQLDDDAVDKVRPVIKNLSSKIAKILY